MMQKQKIDDSMLHAYLDAELDASSVAEVEDWLRKHPEDQARVEQWQQQSEALRHQFDPVLNEPMPPEWSTLLTDGVLSGWTNWMRPAIAASVIFASGVLSGWYIAPGDPQRRSEGLQIADQAVSAHIVYASEVRHPVEVPASEKDHLVGWLSKRLGHNLTAPDLMAAGYTLIGGRLLADDSKPSAQFMYEHENGQRITLYVAANTSEVETAFRIVDSGSVTSFYWLDGPLGFAVTGEVRQNELLPIAHSVYEQLSL